MGRALQWIVFAVAFALGAAWCLYLLVALGQALGLVLITWGCIPIGALWMATRPSLDHVDLERAEQLKSWLTNLSVAVPLILVMLYPLDFTVAALRPSWLYGVGYPWLFDAIIYLGCFVIPAITALLMSSAIDLRKRRLSEPLFAMTAEVRSQLQK